MTPSLEITPSPAQIEMPVRCKLCKRKFKPPAGVVLGESPGETTAKFIQLLFVHLAENHPQHSQIASIHGTEYSGMLMLTNFDVSPTVEKQRDFLRWKINTLTRRSFVSDERIKARVLAMFAESFSQEEINQAMKPGELGSKIENLLREMRDSLIEKNRYDMAETPYLTLT